MRLRWKDLDPWDTNLLHETYGSTRQRDKIDKLFHHFMSGRLEGLQIFLSAFFLCRWTQTGNWLVLPVITVLSENFVAQSIVISSKILIRKVSPLSLDVSLQLLSIWRVVIWRLDLYFYSWFPGQEMGFGLCLDETP